MATAYTPILKLALPVTGELNGTWGTVVNDNITSMVEQAVAGLATINTWTANSHTLTTANGTTSESRCAMLVIDDDGAGNPSAAATVICPTATKSYIVRNLCGQTVTVKTSAGTGVAVPNNQAALVFCDGTNVVTGAFNGDVVGPATSTNNAIVTFDGTTGKVIKDNSGATISAGVITATGFSGPLNGSVGATTPSTVVATQVDITAQGDLRLQDTTGGQFVALQAPGTIATSYTLTLPVDDGTSGQALITDGSGVLSWSTAASGDVYGPASATDNAIARYDGTTGKIIQNSAVTIADDGATVIDANSTSAGLRITQVGTGNALLVEDSANPDTTPTVITADGNVVVGNDTSLTYLTGVQPKIQVNSTGISGIGISRWNAGVATNALTFLKSRGATIGDFTSVASGDFTGSINFYGADGTAGILSSQISAQVDGTPGTGDMPGRLVFSTTADGAAIPTERMRIDSAGRVGIGGTSSGGVSVYSNKNLTGANTAYGVQQSGVIQSDVTVASASFVSIPSTQATSFTLTSLRHFWAVQGTIGATSTVTNQYGFEVSSGLTGATNNYGFYSNIPSGTGRWNFYAAGTAENFFGGNTVISVTDNTNAALRITQVGTGNALVVEDSANPDASPFVIDAAGTVILNNTTDMGGGKLQVKDQNISIMNYGNSAFVNGISNFYKSRSTTPGVFSTVQSGDELGYIFFRGDDGTAFRAAAFIGASVDGTPGTNDMPGRLVFSTTADGSSTPTERMRIDAAGNVGIGVVPSAWGSTFKVMQVSAGSLFSAASNNASFGSNVYVDSASATRYIATTTATRYLQLNGTHRWYNAPSGTAGDVATFTQTAMIDTAGNVGIGGASLTGYTLRLNKAITGSTFAAAQIVDATIQSDVTGGGYSYISRPATVAATFTLGNLYHFYANPQTFGAGSTVTNQYGFHAESSLTGATNDYGFFGNIASGTGRWNFYAAGTADNYFAGALGLGAVATTGSLPVNISYSLTGATSVINVRAIPTILSDVTSSAVLFRTQPFTQAAAFTLGALTHYEATQGTIGATSAIANQYGFSVNSTLSGATNNFGFYSNIASGTGRFNFYANGTAANVFAGTTSIGGLVGAESLRVTPVASSVNYINVNGAPTSGLPSIQAQGSDTDISIAYTSKGTGANEFYTNSFLQRQFRIAHTASAVNYLQVTGAVTTGAPVLSAAGTDTNIDLALTPKGTGLLRFGTYTAGILAQAGYITIKDAAGNTRNLLVG